MLYELIHRYRNGELSFDEFIETCADNFVQRQRLAYPETDGNQAELVAGVSSASISNAVHAGLLTSVEAEAIYAAIPATVS